MMPRLKAERGLYIQPDLCAQSTGTEMLQTSRIYPLLRAHRALEVSENSFQYLWAEPDALSATDRPLDAPTRW
ncbi:hypothetical protein PsYK624_165400 [Phanerochaete sordida]|uniref:Uncharacterized protein n=1 Tax=Phanerochaete sordida TaxID=48140 RepID=A0A9P3LMB6_9APHY|nr:hypothetical protein PsYK624_165400 [Phanerochaete sordida]